MPNTPMLVGEAMSAISAGRHADRRAPRRRGEDARLGRPGRAAAGGQQDAVTALSGSGPAYFFFLVEAMIDAGILLGLPRAVAAELIVQSAYGAAVMLRESGDHPVILREAVTSPAGTTIAAVRELERHGVRAALLGGDRGGARPVGRAGRALTQPEPVSHPVGGDRRTPTAHRGAAPRARPVALGTRSGSAADIVLASARSRACRCDQEAVIRCDRSGPTCRPRPGAVPDGGRGRRADAGVEDDRLPAGARAASCPRRGSAGRSACRAAPSRTTCATPASTRG